MSDLLRMEYINALPQPFIVRFCGDDQWWPVNDFEVGTGMMRIDVCGLLEVKHFSEVMEVKDGDSVTHDPDTFYSDWIDRGPVEDGNIFAMVDLDGQHAIEGFVKHARRQVYRGIAA